MINRIAPLIFDVAGKMASEALQTYVQRRAMGASSGAGAYPYGDITRMVVMAHRYLTRAETAPTKFRLYAELARLEVGDALHYARSTQKGFMRDLVCKKLESLDAQLTSRPNATALASIANDLWALSETTLDIAE